MDKLELEKELMLSGKRYVCGIDEVGRGPLAGPVVCAAIIMPLNEIIEGVDDSKKVPKPKREKLSEQILKKAISYSFYAVPPEVIDEINILQATRLCMKNAIENLAVTPDFVLSDGNMTLDISVPQKSVIGGDAKCYSIGAASIIAKVYRDNLMAGYALNFPHYGFERNSGYGTKEHIEAIKKYGICPVHRRSFVKKWI